jgi:WD40 repeat protein
MTQISCPHCGESHQAGVRFCPKTGQAILVKPTCPHCGAAVEAGWFVCAACGTRLAAEPSLHVKKKVTLVIGGMVVITGLLAGIMLLNKMPSPEPVEQVEGIETGSTALPITFDVEQTDVMDNVPAQSGMATPIAEPLSNVQQLPVLAETPIPWPASTISLQNADDLVELAQWGKGNDFSVTYSSNSNLIALGTMNGIHLYDADTLIESGFITTDAPIRNITFSPEGTLLASIRNKNTVDLWNLENGGILSQLIIQDEVIFQNELTFSPYGKIVAIGCRDNYPVICLLDLHDGNLQNVLSMDGTFVGDVTSIAFSVDGRLLASGFTNGSVWIWNTNDWSINQKIHVHQYGVSDIAFSPAGSLLAVTDSSDRVTLWNVNDGTRVNSLRGVNIFTSLALAFSPDGEILAISSEDGVKLWKLPDETEVTLTDSYGGVGLDFIAFSSDGKILFSGRRDNVNFRISSWNVVNGNLLNSLEIQSDIPMKLTYLESGKLLALGLKDRFGKYLRLWQVNDDMTLLEAIANLDSTVIADPTLPSKLSMSSTGHIIAWVTLDGDVWIWDMYENAAPHILLNQLDRVESLALSADGQILATASSVGAVRLWKIDNGQFLQTISGTPQGVLSVAFSPDGTILATGSNAGHVHLWRVLDGDLIQTLLTADNRITDLVFSPGGTLLSAVTYSDKVNIYELRDGSLISSIDPENYVSGGLRVAFSKDGKLIAIGDGDGRINLYSVFEGDLLWSTDQHIRRIQYITFSPDDGFLISGSEDGTIRLWGIAP